MTGSSKTSKCRCKAPVIHCSILYQQVTTSLIRYTSTGEREYSTLSNADWLLDLKEQLPCGTWVCPVVWASDKTNITNTGRSAYPVYMTLGSLGIDRR